MAYSTPSIAGDAALDEAIRGAQQGDEDSFRLVYRAVHPGLLRYLTVLVGEADAEDVCSESWAQIARDLDSFHGDADGFRGWTATVGRHRALDHLRQLRRRPSSDLSVDELPERVAPDDTAGSALDSLATTAALGLLAELPREQAEAVLLRVVIGLDAPGAARVLGKRPGAVRTAAHRGLKKLAERIGSAEHRDAEHRGNSEPADLADGGGAPVRPGATAPIAAAMRAPDPRSAGSRPPVAAPAVEGGHLGHAPGDLPKSATPRHE